MKVYVMTAEPECPAHWALAQEHVEHEVLDLSADEFAYGRSFADLWDQGDPFIHLEHDIVPWPGAIAELAECPESWCVHYAPVCRGEVRMGFGIGKYRPKGRAPDQWRERDWYHLDSLLVSGLRQRFGSDCCTHTPPVAHARRVTS